MSSLTHPSFNTHSALTGGLGGSNGILKRPNLTNIIMGGMEKKSPTDGTDTMHPGTNSIVGTISPPASTTTTDDDSSL